MRIILSVAALASMDVAASVAAFNPFHYSALRRDDRPLDARQVRGANCTDRSLALKTLRIYGGELLKDDRENPDSSSISFRVENPLTGQNERCAAEGPQVTYDPDIWFNCDHISDPTAPRSSFRFDMEKGEVSVQGTWICSDKDPEKPYVIFL